jgi:hypothetical protein
MLLTSAAGGRATRSIGRREAFQPALNRQAALACAAARSFTEVAYMSTYV